MNTSSILNEEPTQGNGNYFIILLTGFITVMLLIFTIFWVLGRTEASKTATKTEDTGHTERVKQLEAELQVSNTALKDQAARVKTVTGLRRSIAAELDIKLKGLGLNLEVDKDTGNIRFAEGLLFEPNRDVINALGYQYLDTFMPVYISTILSPAFKDYIDTIVIEGHADDEGSYTANLELAQKRASAVAKQVVSRNYGSTAGVNGIEKYLSTSSRSNSQPVMAGGTSDKAKSRRVEIRFLLKEEKVYQDLMKAVGDGG